jgi:hypothetical protein
MSICLTHYTSIVAKNAKRTDQRMFEVRSSGPRTFISLLLLFVIASSLSLAAQEKDKDIDKEDKAKRKAAGYVDISGTVRCAKPDESHALDVPDRDGHSLIIARRKCTWSEPLVILGGKTKEGVWIAFQERMEGTLHPHSFEVDTMNDGEKITMQTMGIVDAEKGPTSAKGRFSFMRGTGKYKGIKGGGTYAGQLDAEDVLILKLEGAYEPAVMAGGKK